MTKFIKIESKGIIDTQAFSLLGASSKREDKTKIGFFGSGLKYSIAYLLRNKIAFRTFADYKEIKFTTTPIPFRDKSFDVISVDGKETSMTTEMGMDWEPWFAIREIYCNALDEGESHISIVSENKCLPIEDKTVFYIQATAEFQDIVDNWDLYFSENRKDLLYSDTEMNQLYTGGDKLIVYRKGIRCLYSKEEKTIFNYDLSWVQINESRTIKSEWDFKYSLKGWLQKITNPKIIAHIMNTINDRWEKELHWELNANLYSETWLKVIGAKTLVPFENSGFWQETITEIGPNDFIILPSNMVIGLKDKFTDAIHVIGDVDGVKGDGGFRAITILNKKQDFLLKEAVSFLTEAGFEIKYPIKVVEFIAKEQLGQAKDGTILLSTKLFDKSRKDLVGAIVEEQEHLATGYNDLTRAFQTHFIHKYVSVLEEKINKYL